MNVREHDLSAREMALRNDKKDVHSQQREVDALMNTFMMNKENAEKHYSDVLAKETEVNEKSKLLRLQMEEHAKIIQAAEEQTKAAFILAEESHMKEVQQLQTKVGSEIEKRREKEMRVLELEKALKAREGERENEARMQAEMEKSRRQSEDMDRRERDLAIRMEMLLKREEDANLKLKETLLQQRNLTSALEKLAKDQTGAQESKLWQDTVVAEKMEHLALREQAIAPKEHALGQKERHIGEQSAALDKRKKEVEQAEHRQKCDVAKLTSLKAKFEKERSFLLIGFK